MYRGRLIFPIFAEIYRLDTASSSVETNSGETSAGYDNFFREPVVFENNEEARVEFPPVKIPAQVLGQRNRYGTLQAQAGGATEGTSVELVFHLRDLEALGLVDADGRVLISLGDRLGGLYKYKTGALIRRYTTRPLFLTEAGDRGIGIAGDRNLMLCKFDTRDKSTVTGIT